MLDSTVKASDVDFELSLGHREYFPDVYKETNKRLIFVTISQSI